MRLALLLAFLIAAPAMAQATDAVPGEADAALARAADRATWAPTARGVRLLGGYASAGGFTGRFQSAGIEPEVGRFVADGLALSLRLGVNANRSSYTNTDFDGTQVVEQDFRSSGYGLSFGPSVTKYFGSTGEAVYPFVGVGAFGYVSRSSSGLEGEPRSVQTNGSLAGLARVGVMVPVARNVSIEAQLVGGLYDLSPRVRGDVGFAAGIATFLY
jgi:hypothetical protein